MTKVIKKRPYYGTTTQGISSYEQSHRALSRKAATEGIVLLKNENQILPLKEGGNIALFGTGVSHMVKGGTGSGDVNEREVVSICQGLQNAGYRIVSQGWIDEYDSIYTAARNTWRDGIMDRVRAVSATGLDFFNIYSTTPFFMPDGPDVTNSDAETAMYVISRVAGEGADRCNTAGDYYLTAKEKKDIADLCGFYQNVILVINTGGVIDLSYVDSYPNVYAILYLVQPGMEGGNALADVVRGKVTPSGKLTDTWANRYEDYPNASTFSHMNGNIHTEKYEEGIYVGYRYFDAFEIPVRYGFGYGLSYTDFRLETTGITAGPEINVEVRVTNTGMVYSGKEVVQVYVTPPSGTLEKEYRRLCGFAKTSNLAPGQSEVLHISFPVYQMASFDNIAAEWILDQGSYGLWVGNSLNSSTLEGVLVLEEKKVLARVKNICPLQEELSELSYSTDKRNTRCAAEIETKRKQGIREITLDLAGIKTEALDYTASFEAENDEAAAIVDKLNMEQLILLSTGDPGKGQGSSLGAAGISVPGSAGETSTAAYEQGVANIVLADGPAGLRLNQVYSVQDGRIQMPPFEASLEHGFFCENVQFEGTKHYQYCTAIPVGTLLAQTWNEKLMVELGAMVADEMVRFGVTLWLAPGMNIHRNPLCGRNFEYYSEDPFISGKMAAAMTKGVQSVAGCGTTVKHFACNNQEDNRMGSDSIVSERALREIYLKGFEIAIKDAKPMAMMTSYNLINGVHAANCRDLCTVAARQEWGFDGIIVTDWTTTEHGEDCTASGCIRAGNDLIMPGQLSDHENLRKELEQGTLEEKDIRKCITRLVRVILRSNLYENT